MNIISLNRLLLYLIIDKAYFFGAFKKPMELLPVSAHVYLFFELQRGEVQNVVRKHVFWGHIADSVRERIVEELSVT